MILRPAEPADALGVATVNVRAWQRAYRGLIADDYLDSLRAEDRARGFGFATGTAGSAETIVAVDGDMIVGFATTLPCRDAETPSSGEVGALYVDPSHWSRGVGRELMHAARERLAARGFADAVLWVLRGNERAMRFYERDGWYADATERVATVWGVSADEVRYRRTLGHP